MLVKDIVHNFNAALKRIGKPSVPELEREATQLCQQIQSGQLTPDALPSEHVVVRLIDYYGTEALKQRLKGIVASPGYSHEQTCLAYKDTYGIDNVEISREGLEQIRYFLEEGGISPDEVLKLEPAK